MNDVKAITFFDLDGTLLNEKSQVTLETTQAIAQLKRNKVLPIIATGRSLIEIQPIMKQSGIDSAIVMNGQYIQINGETIYSSVFTNEEVHKLYTHVKKQGDELAFYNSHQIWCTGHNEIVENAYSFIHSAPPIIDRTNLEEKTINMMLILTMTGDDYYYKNFPNITFYRNSPYSIDIVKKGGSKGSGVKYVLETLQVPTIPTFAFGDGLNDLPLFSACNYSIAMGNAREEVKEKASFITKKNTENGIIEGLKKFDLL